MFDNRKQKIPERYEQGLNCAIFKIFILLVRKITGLYKNKCSIFQIHLEISKVRNYPTSPN